MLNPSAPTFRVIDEPSAFRPPMETRDSSNNLQAKGVQAEQAVLTGVSYLRAASPAFHSSRKPTGAGAEIVMPGPLPFLGAFRRGSLLSDAASSDSQASFMPRLPTPSELRDRGAVVRSTSPMSPEPTPQKRSHFSSSARSNIPHLKASEKDNSLPGSESIWSPRGNDMSLGGLPPTTSTNPLYPGTYAFGGPGYAPAYGNDQHSTSSQTSTNPSLHPRMSMGSGFDSSKSGNGMDRSYLAPPGQGQHRQMNSSSSYPGAMAYASHAFQPQTSAERAVSRSSMSGGGTTDSRVIGQRDMLDGSWVCGCGLQNPVYFGICAKCRSPQPSFTLPAQPMTPPAMSQQHRSSQSAFNHQDLYANEGYQQHQPRTFGGVPISPLAVLSKLANHVEELITMGRDGIELKMVLVEGDVNVCLAMGMRGLVGKEAINPWKCMGVEIPDQHIGKYGPKPPLGTIAGDWSCSCGRENWAKRSVCSRCFPGIEPDYKVIVYQYAEPIFRMVAEQEQHAEIQRGTEWLALEEKKLRREQQQQRQYGNQPVGPSGPTIGRKFIADFKLPRSRSPYAEAAPFRPSTYSDPRRGRMPEDHERPAVYSEVQQSMPYHPGYPSSSRLRPMEYANGMAFTQGPAQIPFRSMGTGNYDHNAQHYINTQGGFHAHAMPLEAAISPMQYDRHFPVMPVGPPSSRYHEAEVARDMMPDNSPPEPRFHLISSPESASSFRFSPFSPDPNVTGDGAPWRVQHQSPESPTATMRSRTETRASAMPSFGSPQFMKRTTDPTGDEYILTGEITRSMHHPNTKSSVSSGRSPRLRLPIGQEAEKQEMPQSKRSVDPIGQGRPISANAISKVEASQNKSPEGHVQHTSRVTQEPDGLGGQPGSMSQSFEPALQQGHSAESELVDALVATRLESSSGNLPK